MNKEQQIKRLRAEIAMLETEMKEAINDGEPLGYCADLHRQWEARCRELSSLDVED